MIEPNPVFVDRRMKLAITVFGEEIFVGFESDAELVCEFDCAVAGEEAMLGFGHHPPRERDRVPDVRNKCDRT